MATGSIRNPDDASNTGPREATRTFTEDSVTKHLPRFQIQENRLRNGMWYAHSGAFVVLAAAHGAGAGYMWLINHVSSGVLVALRRIRCSSQHGSALPTPTSPRVLMERFTFTGTASGAQITPAKRRSSDAAQGTWSIRTANTGMTQTAGAVHMAFFPVAALTAVGACTPLVDEWEPPTPDDQIILAAGEGLRIYQADAGTASDTRRLFFDLTIEEIASEF